MERVHFQTETTNISREYPDSFTYKCQIEFRDSRSLTSKAARPTPPAQPPSVNRIYKLARSSHPHNTTTADADNCFQPQQTGAKTNMRGVCGALVVVVATSLVCCSADPHREQDVSGSEQGPKRYDLNDYKQAEELEEFIRFVQDYENRRQDRVGLGGLGGNSLLGRNIHTGGLGGSSLLGSSISLAERNTNGLGGSSLLGRNLNGIGGSNMLGRDVEGDKRQYARFVDSLGGGNFVRNLDSIGGGNFVRNLDSIGGNNFVKKNLDQLGGPNLVKRNLDSLGGGNFVRNLDSLGGGNFVRQLDPLGGGNFV